MMESILGSRWLPVLMLVASNVFMTFAWYGHLRYKGAPLWTVVLVSWGIAFFEYLIMVPANRMGHVFYSTVQLKVLQEVITLSVFSVFVVAWMGESIRWNHLVAAFALLLGAVLFAFLPTES